MRGLSVCARWRRRCRLGLELLGPGGCRSRLRCRLWGRRGAWWASQSGSAAWMNVQGWTNAACWGELGSGKSMLLYVLMEASCAESCRWILRLSISSPRHLQLEQTTWRFPQFAAFEWDWSFSVPTWSIGGRSRHSTKRHIKHYWVTFIHASSVR